MGAPGVTVPEWGTAVGVPAYPEFSIMLFPLENSGGWGYYYSVTNCIGESSKMFRNTTRILRLGKLEHQQSSFLGVESGELFLPPGLNRSVPSPSLPPTLSSLTSGALSQTRHARPQYLYVLAAALQMLHSGELQASRSNGTTRAAAGIGLFFFLRPYPTERARESLHRNIRFPSITFKSVVGSENKHAKKSMRAKPPTIGLMVFWQDCRSVFHHPCKSVVRRKKKKIE